MAEPSMKSFILDGSERSVQDVVSKLRFIATLKPHERVDVATLSVQPDSYGARAYRTFLARGESRVATLEFIRQTLGEAFDLASAYSIRTEPFNQKIKLMILDALSDSKSGIESLKETYKSDRMFVSRVATLIGTLDAKVTDLAGVGRR